MRDEDTGELTRDQIPNTILPFFSYSSLIKTNVLALWWWEEQSSRLEPWTILLVTDARASLRLDGRLAERCSFYYTMSAIDLGWSTNSDQYLEDFELCTHMLVSSVSCSVNGGHPMIEPCGLGALLNIIVCWSHDREFRTPRHDDDSGRVIVLVLLAGEYELTGGGGVIHTPAVTALASQ